MFYLPPLRRFLLPTLIFLAIITFYRSSLRVSTSFQSFIQYQPVAAPKTGIRVPISTIENISLPIRNASESYLHYDQGFFYDYETVFTLKNGSKTTATWNNPIDHPHIAPLLNCPIIPNPRTGHIRLPEMAQNMSMSHPGLEGEETRGFWNPTIISLPYWSPNTYLLISRIVTPGVYQETFFCEAKTCYSGVGTRRPREENCTEEDLKLLGPNGGMRCMTEPKQLEVPSTPAEKCEGKFYYYPDIPGFHDPRVFWSSKGEPLMMVNTHSQYACFGLWMIDLRTLHPPLIKLLSSSPRHPSLGPLISYPHLTELTRNPRSTRAMIEKNWFIFSPSSKAATYLNYDLDPSRRTFAKLLGHGYTTPNLTDPYELPCVPQPTEPSQPGSNQTGQYHQATNALKLVLCRRSSPSCKEEPTNTAFFAVLHKKHNNNFKLPMRYERYFILWSGHPPFTTLAISAHPILMYNETASPYFPLQNWESDPENDELLAAAQKEADHTLNEDELNKASKQSFSVFSYTVSIAWAARGGDWEELGDKHQGYLDDEVVLGIGLDDQRQVFARAKAEDLLGCMRACPGRDVQREESDRRTKEEARKQTEEEKENGNAVAEVETEAGIRAEEGEKADGVDEMEKEKFVEEMAKNIVLGEDVDDLDG